MPSADKILSMQIGDKAHIIASSEEIKDDDNNPPCYEAKIEYEKQLKQGGKHFLNTAVYRTTGGIPQPIVFIIGETGKRLKDSMMSAGVSSISRPAPRAGND